MCFQGVSFSVHVHPARALTEQKEFSASPLYVDSGAISALGWDHSSEGGRRKKKKGEKKKKTRTKKKKKKGKERKEERKIQMKKKWER